MTFRSVDLPIPLGPTIASRSPRTTSRSTPCSTLFSPKDFDTPFTFSTSRPLGRTCPKRKTGYLRELMGSGSSVRAFFSISRSLLCACRAFDALARNRSTNCRWCEISRSRWAISFSRRSRSAAFAVTKRV